MITRRSVLGGALASAVLWPAVAGADYATVIDPSKSYGVWEGWGAALSWWANVFGTNDRLADLFYTRGTVPLDNGRDHPGLGLNIVRYNLGACTWQPAGTQHADMYESPNIARRKQLAGYWLNWDNEDPASASWDWSADSRQRAMMAKARDRGANLFEMFSVSPLWWMCRNLDPSGAGDGGDNLQSWNHRQHAVYLATVAKYAHDQWGVDFTSVEPFNEPTIPWKWDGNQEGCHFGQDVQADVIGRLRAELDARGLSWMKVAASDENKYREATATWNSFTPGVKSRVGRVNVHGYQYGNDGGPRSALYDAVHADGKGLWQTEYGEGDATGLSLAYNLSIDLRYLHPTAWSYWQPVDGATWGLVSATYDDPDGTTGQIHDATNKYFVLAQYTRHIRPGMRIIDSGDQATVAAYDPAGRRLVLVTVRGDSRQQVTYDLSRFTITEGSAVRCWATDVNPNGAAARQYAAQPDLHTAGRRFSADFEPYVVQTFEIDNVAA